MKKEKEKIKANGGKDEGKWEKWKKKSGETEGYSGTILSSSTSSSFLGIKKILNWLFKREEGNKERERENEGKWRKIKKEEWKMKGNGRKGWGSYEITGLLRHEGSNVIIETWENFKLL